MNTPRILTDLEILQSQTWQSTVNYVGKALLPSSKLVESLCQNHALLPLLNSIKILFLRTKYDIVINGSLRTGQSLALLKKILGFSTPRQIILELMLDEEQETFLWKIKRRIQQFIFSKTDLIFVSSKSEVKTYSERLHLPEHRIRFVPFHTNIVEPRIVQGKGNYLFSAGKTGRDFVVLIQAVRNLDCSVVIVSDQNSIQGTEIPSNVKLLLDIPYSKYLELLFDCRAVIVPLKPLVKSTGQVVILEAMALGKPVIATETVGTVDYIQSGVNGLLVPPADPGCLATAISQLLTDPAFCRFLSENGLQTVKEFHTFEIYVDTILNAARELSTQ